MRKNELGWLNFFSMIFAVVCVSLHVLSSFIVMMNCFRERERENNEFVL